MAFTYGLYIKPYIFYTIIAIATVGTALSAYMMWARPQGFVKTCVDFRSQESAQRAFLGNRMLYAGLDADSNGIACQDANYH